MRKNWGIDYYAMHVTGQFTLLPSRKSIADFGSVDEFELIDIWSIFCRELQLVKNQSRFQANAFVLMDNHFHLLCSLNRERGDTVLGFQFELEKTCSLFISKIESSFISDEKSLFFSQSPHQFLISDFKHYSHVYRYIYRNPVEGGLVDRVEDYPLSSLYYLLGKGDSVLFPVTDNMQVASDPIRILRWLNSHELESSFSLNSNPYQIQY